MIFRRFIQLMRNHAHYKRTMRLLFVSIQKNVFVYKILIPKKHAISGTVLAGLIWDSQSEPNSVLTKKEIMLAKADALFDEGKYKEIYELLQNYKDSNDVDILWRLGRALYKMSESASDVEAKKHVSEGFDIISKALELDPNNFVIHKWMSVLLDKKSEHVGMKERIKQLENVKKHMLRATELNPNDATTLYMLGQWCFSVADLSWYQRKLAAAFFASPPESTYEEALEFFKKAESIEPNFYSYNLLMLGKTYMKLNNMDEAKKYLTSASEYTAKTDEDHKAKQEAMNLLTKI